MKLLTFISLFFISNTFSMEKDGNILKKTYTCIKINKVLSEKLFFFMMKASLTDKKNKDEVIKCMKIISKSFPTSEKRSEEFYLKKINLIESLSEKKSLSIYSDLIKVIEIFKKLKIKETKKDDYKNLKLIIKNFYKNDDELDNLMNFSKKSILKSFKKINSMGLIKLPNINKLKESDIIDIEDTYSNKMKMKIAPIIVSANAIVPTSMEKIVEKSVKDILKK